jgi:murein DD-endopeptidase MepM/ murein hydrolase activator NlpD
MPNQLQPAYSYAQAGYSAGAARRLRRRPAAHVSIGRRVVLIWAAAFVLLLTWAAASTSYILFRDRLLRDLRRHHAAAERVADNQNAQLRLELDHLRSARMTDRALFGDEIDRLERRQTLLERRELALGEVAGISRSHVPSDAAATRTPPPPVSDTVHLATPRQPPRESRIAPLRLPAAPAVKEAAGLPHTGRLAMLARGYDAVEAAQASAVAQFERKLDGQRNRLRAIYDHIGLTPPAPGSDTAADTGGPYIPIAASPLGGDTAFDRALRRIVKARLDVQRLRAGLNHLPVLAPLPELVETSGFGAREDPFVGSLAFHPGIDLRAAVGTPVHATAAGTVTIASWTGGYGNLIEIDNGNGIRTRYGHLSEFEVKVGDHIVPGQEIGRTGSTGRSTGPHLHYEVRIDGQPVDPTRFVTAEQALVSAASAQEQD